MKSRVTADQEMRQLNVKLAQRTRSSCRTYSAYSPDFPTMRKRCANSLLGSARGSTSRRLFSVRSSMPSCITSTLWRTYRCSFTSATSRSPHTAPSHRGSSALELLR
jgi:hypothetical protein